LRVLVIGANGHVGSAAVDALRPRHDVVGVGRSTNPAVDATDPASIGRLFEAVGEVDAIVSAIGSAPFKPLADLSRDDYLAAFTGKVLSQLDIVRIGMSHVRDGGSITLTTGVLAREPIATGAAAAVANGAIEAFVMAAAAELPRGLRINAVSPTVLEEAESYHEAFPGFIPVPAKVVGQAFRKSVEGVQTGRIFEVE
jgi:NAD(P)-dependent dehydrogenase (short-subunit alcohol dehydrogenase family)